jgi:hypothetical protein
MVVGYPPFFSDDAVTTCQKIVNWRKYLKYPDGVSFPAPCGMGEPFSPSMSTVINQTSRFPLQTHCVGKNGDEVTTPGLGKEASKPCCVTP